MLRDASLSSGLTSAFSRSFVAERSRHRHTDAPPPLKTAPSYACLPENERDQVCSTATPRSADQTPQEAWATCSTKALPCSSDDVSQSWPLRRYRNAVATVAIRHQTPDAPSALRSSDITKRWTVKCPTSSLCHLTSYRRFWRRMNTRKGGQPVRIFIDGYGKAFVPTDQLTLANPDRVTYEAKTTP